MSQKLANKTDAKSRKDLPPPREDKAIRTDVPAPLTNTSLTTVIYYISAAMLLYFAYYAYLMTQWCVLPNTSIFRYESIVLTFLLILWFHSRIAGRMNMAVG